MATESNSSGPAMANESALQRFVRATEVDTRVIGMLAALLAIWIAFDITSGLLRPGSGGLFG